MNAKGKIKMFAIIGLVALIAVGSTLAYLSSVTETKTNVFTSDKNITANITETKWDGGSDYTPGEAKNKNPQIVNESKDTPMHTGVKIEFIKNETQPNGEVVSTPISYNDFKANYGSLVGTKDNDKDGFNDAWTLKTGTNDTKGVFVEYNEPLAAGATTDPAVFDQVLISIGITKSYNTKYTTNTVYEAKKNADGTYEKDKNGNYVADTSKPISSTTSEPETSVVYTNEKGEKIDDLYVLPSFDIKVTGYAVQTTGPDGYDPSTELLKLADL